jgi:hypothetical protein
VTRPAAHLLRLALPALAAVALLLAAVAPAHAARPLYIGTTTHGPLFDGDDTTVGATMARARGAGIRFLRVYTSWEQLSPGGTSKPPGFDSSDPGDPRYRWGGIDRIVREALSHGIEPILSLQEAPRWAERGGGGPPSTNNPDPNEFGQFAHAAAARYSGSFGGLPRVHYFEAWDEPNFDGFLSPQFDGAGNAVSPGIYRALVNALADNVKAVHGDNLVVAGALASFSKPGHAVGPLDFMRQLLCMSGGRKPAPTCRADIRFDIWAVDPYTVGNAFHKSISGGGVSLGDLPTMGRLLRAATRAGQITHDVPVQYWITEFSWDSNPPDPQGTPIGQLMRQIPESLYQSWRSGVTLYTWYTLDDDPIGQSPYQSGLFFGDGDAKPFLATMKFPFVAYRRGKRHVYVWGITPDYRRGRVAIEQQAGKSWRRRAVVRTNVFGIFSRTIRTSSRRPLRANFGGDTSVPFALIRTPDNPYPAFGTP